MHCSLQEYATRCRNAMSRMTQLFYLACACTRLSMNVADSNLPRLIGNVRHSKPRTRAAHSSAALGLSVASSSRLTP